MNGENTPFKNKEPHKVCQLVLISELFLFLSYEGFTEAAQRVYLVSDMKGYTSVNCFTQKLCWGLYPDPYHLETSKG